MCVCGKLSIFLGLFEMNYFLCEAAHISLHTSYVKNLFNQWETGPISKSNLPNPRYFLA